MKCPRCAAQNQQDARFCEDCGVRLELSCPSCGQPITPGKKFCRSCGMAVSADAVASSPSSYTPKHLVEKILTSKAALEGERKQVTVLFADLKGSMELLADRDPEEARKILDPVLELMMEAVHRYEGTVNQVMGDGIMALFGAPVAHEDHAIRACYAALRMQDSVKRYAEGMRRQEGVTVLIRVGLNSGEVVVRSIGSDLHMDYTAVGQTTHLAARLEQIAAPGSIMLAPDTLRLVEGYVVVKSLGRVQVKGLSEPIEVFEMTGAGAVRTRLQRSAIGGFTPFVGRDAVMEQLQDAFARAAGGRGQVVAVLGDPGVGKSRLFHEFLHSDRVARSSGRTPPAFRGGWRVVESHSVAYGKATPYLPVIELLRAYFDIDQFDARAARETVSSKLVELDETLRSLLPAFLSLLDERADNHEWQVLDPIQRRRHTHDAIRRLLLRESQRQPLCLVFEDLHWIDAESQAVLDGLVESLPASRIVLLTNYRPEYRHSWGSKTYYTQVRIDPLPEASATELLRALLGTDASLRPLIALLIERTEGNPFFLEESVRTLVETGVLADARGRCRLVRSVGNIRIPATVQAVIAGRIDRLPPAEKNLLQLASIVGKDVPFAELHAVAELPEDTLRVQFAHLLDGEFLYETSLFPQPEYTFKHALTHEVTYGTVLHERRRALHAKLVPAIETLHRDRLIEHVERLALHALRGHVWPKAVAYLRRASTKAVARSANREAVGCLEQALDVVKHLPSGPETDALAIDLRLDLQIPLNGLGEIERLLNYLREAEPLAATLADEHRMGRIAAYTAFVLIATGQHEQAAASAERALAAARSVGDRALEVQANLRIGQACSHLGEYSRAITALKRNVDTLVGDLRTERFALSSLPAVVSRAFMAGCLASLGQFSVAREVADEAARIAETAKDRGGLSIAQARRGWIFVREGSPERALPALERSLDDARRGGFEVGRLSTAFVLGEAKAASGAIDEALALLEQTVEQAVSVRFVANVPEMLGALGVTYLLAGRLADARRAGEQSLQMAQASGERPTQGDALLLLGEVHARMTPPEFGEATQAYRKALTIGKRMGARPLVAHSHFGLAKLYRRTGQPEQAREHLTTATTMYREMGMTYWLEKAEAETTDLGR
jgi:class 3 adenylate cyclase/tetratricopeptide (TPR) repeat protein